MISLQRIVVGTLLGALLLAVCIPVFAETTATALSCAFVDSVNRDPSFSGPYTNCSASAGAVCTMPYGLSAQSNIEGTLVNVVPRVFNVQMSTTSTALAQSTPMATKQLRPGEKITCRTHQFGYALTVADANAFCAYQPLYGPSVEECTGQQNWLLDRLASVLGVGLVTLAGFHGFSVGYRR